MTVTQVTKPKEKRATIYEVARMARVSHVTVTRAFSEEASVSDDTRKKVLAAAKRLEYRPNLLAKGLNGARTETMAVVWPMGYTFISEQAIAELVNKAQQRNYQIQLANTLNEVQMVKLVLDDLLHRAVDAVVLNITPETFDSEVESILRKFRAAVVITVADIEIAVDQIVWDRTAAIKAAIDHVIKAGKKHVGYFCFTVKQGPSGQTVRIEDYKAQAFISCLREHEVADPEKGIVDIETNLDWDDIGTCKSVLQTQFSNDRFPFDAVLCLNDDWATVLMSMLKRHGLRVPEDVAVIGYNDSRVAILCEPPLASVNRCNQDVVSTIENLIFTRLENRDVAPRKKVVPMRFVWRESAG